MIRTALRPRWLALLALLVVVSFIFVRLGLWQLRSATDHAAQEYAAQQAALETVPVSQVLGPHQAFPPGGVAHPVTVTGEYDPALQFLVPDRRLEGRTGYWVVTPVRTDQSGQDALIAVVRGFVTDPADAGEVAAGPVTVSGGLAPSESPSTVGGLPEGQRTGVDTADLANAWGEPIYNAFIFAEEEDPQLSAATVQRVPVPVFGAGGGVDWRNLGYGLQWFVFIGFAVYMYLRFLREASRTTTPSTGASS